MDIFGAAHGCWGAKRPPSSKSVTHILKWWNLAQLYLTYRRSKRYINHVTYPLSSADISIFSLEIRKFKTLKIFLINLVITLMMSAKMATPGLLKITVFWNKGYDVIISVDDVTNKILSRDSNYIVDLFMWPKFGNSSISMREVITTSIS